jgi:hypothetical protein
MALLKALDIMAEQQEKRQSTTQPMDGSIVSLKEELNVLRLRIGVAILRYYF